MSVRPSLIDLPLSPTARELVAWSKAHRLADRARELDERPRFPSEVFRALGRRRFLGLTLSRARGGRELALPDAGAALLALAHESGTTFAKLALQPEFCGVLAREGSPAQRSKFFRPLIEGRLLIGNQITEPDAGSDLRALSSRATPVVSGFELSGIKSEAAFAVDARQAIVYANVSEGDFGPTAWLVDQRLPGVRRQRSAADLGERWMRRGTVRYRRVRLPRSARIGREGDAYAYLARELTEERALLAAIDLGVGRRAWELAAVRAAERTSMGRPLARHQAIGFALAEAWSRLDAATLYAFDVLARLERGEEADARAAMAKFTAVEESLAILDLALQVHGARGYSDEFPFARWWRDVRSGRLAHGTSEILRHLATRRLWPDRPAARGEARGG